MTLELKPLIAPWFAPAKRSRSLEAVMCPYANYVVQKAGGGRRRETSVGRRIGMGASCCFFLLRPKAVVKGSVLVVVHTYWTES